MIIAREYVCMCVYTVSEADYRYRTFAIFYARCVKIYNIAISRAGDRKMRYATAVYYEWITTRRLRAAARRNCGNIFQRRFIARSQYSGE